MCSRGRILALGDRLAVSVVTAKRLPSVKIRSSLRMREPPRLSLMGTCFSVLIRMELARLREQIIPLWMYPFGADVGSEAIVNQKQQQPSRPGGPAAPILNGSESASTYSVEQQAPAAKPYIAPLQ